MSVGEIAEGIHRDYPSLSWAGYWGVLYNVLDKADSLPGSPIWRVQGTTKRMYQYIPIEKMTDKEEETTTVDASAEEIFEEANARAIQELRALLKAQIQRMDNYAFEELVNQLIVAMGFGKSHETTPKSNDGGIDGIVYGDALGLNVVYVQSKHYRDNHSVTKGEILQFIGAAKGRNGVFVTSSDFTKGARDAASNTGTTAHIALISGEELVGHLIKHEIGIRTHRMYTLYEVNEEYFDELNAYYSSAIDKVNHA